MKTFGYPTQFIVATLYSVGMACVFAFACMCDIINGFLSFRFLSKRKSEKKKRAKKKKKKKESKDENKSRKSFLTNFLLMKIFYENLNTNITEIFSGGQFHT